MEPEEERQILDRLDEEIGALGLSRRQFAKEVDIPETTVQSWFGRGKIPNAKAFIKIGQRKGISLTYVLLGRQAESLEDEIMLRVVRELKQLTPDELEDALPFIKGLVQTMVARRKGGATGEALA